MSARRYYSEPWKIENILKPLAVIVWIISYETGTRHPGTADNTT